jgi:ATP-dependent RNA helicase RhlE
MAGRRKDFDLTDFTSLGLAEPLLRAVAGEGYTQPTPIQAAAIPVQLSGVDMIGIAQTGTGKTAAFVLPILHKLSLAKQAPVPRTASILILTPTRELAGQIGENIRTYGKFMRVTQAVVVGGAGMGGQVRALSRGVDIVIATPGRLIDHMQEGTFVPNHTHTVVLDEADQMLDLGFMPQIRRILAKLALKRQTLLFSATMPGPIRLLADEFLREPQEVAVAPTAKPIDRIEQRAIACDGAGKRAKLVELLGAQEVESAIVFTRTKRGADRVCEYLDAAGIAAAAIHGNKSQNQRERALAAFRAGKVWVLVATDIAARGIDVDGVSHVINYELPNVPESYVHRIGRTARAGASGIAIALVDSTEFGLLRDIERLIGRQLIERPEMRGRGPRQVPTHNPQAPRPQQPAARPQQHGRPGQAAAKPRGPAQPSQRPRSDDSRARPQQNRSRAAQGR